jgi:chaperonin GroES
MTLIKPLGTRVVIEPVKPKETTVSGLVIPQSAQADTNEAIVIDVSKSVEDVKVGDRVIYSMYGGTKVEYDGRSFMVIEIADLICIVE